jgi:two-component system sensor histidine kinase KdpD
MNTDPYHPDPDPQLVRTQHDEEPRPLRESGPDSDSRRGRLKIFLGYAAGVGKTYAMLEAARQRQIEGLDVVIGYVETHTRAETDALADGLEVVSRKSIEVHGIELAEMDVDAVLARHPRLVLVDELAHTNAPGSRHPKRYQDVDELLSAGIDVYTTLNIQHLASLTDVVAQITGTIVHETVPDSVIDAAAEIELIDLPPDELLQRLHDGKVYIPEQAARALDEFFRKGNLTALREMTMRRAAERVDGQMRAYMQTRAIPGPWQAAERLLVCINANTLGERLVRATRRLADELKAEWFAVYVETPEYENISQANRDQVARSLHLAEELGARIKILSMSPTAPTIAATIHQYAHKHNVTKIVVGKPHRSAWLDWLRHSPGSGTGRHSPGSGTGRYSPGSGTGRHSSGLEVGGNPGFSIVRGSIVEQLIRQSENIDIHVIASTEAGKQLPSDEVSWQPHRPLRRYLGSLALVALAAGVSEIIGHEISPTNLVMVYLLAVIVSAVYFGRGPAILASFLSVIVFDFFFVPPFMTLAVSNTEYLLTFAGLFSVGWVISYMTARAREQAESARRREADTATLYALSRDLAAADGIESVLQAIQTHIEQAFGREVIMYLADGGELLQISVPSTDSSPGDANTVPVLERGETEIAVALWAFKNGESAGRGTNTLPSARFRYMPLKTAQRTVGVLGVSPQDSQATLTPDQRRLFEALASQAAQAIERVQLAEQARQVKLLQAAEKLQNALLNSISHDLRTPLVSITGALSTLEQDDQLDQAARQSLVETAREEADRLNRLVGNLLDMTRLESGALRVKRDACDIQDLVGAALGQMETRLAERQIKVAVATGIPLVPLDFVLIVHVLINLLDNALKYSPEKSPLEIQASLQDHEVQIAVLDNGIGVPADDLDRIFDKFYRVQRPEYVTGTGLGLAICKGIIEAHGGRIWASNRDGGGTIFTLALPLEVSE